MAFRLCHSSVLLGLLLYGPGAWSQPRQRPHAHDPQHGTAAAVSPPGSPAERLERATVTVIVDGEARTLGVALRGDGRVLTSLSALGSYRGLVLRFPDGRAESAAAVATDASWGLALLQA